MANGGKHRKKPGNPRGNPATLRPPWKKGESGNPRGRPPGSVDFWASIVKELRKKDRSGKTKAEKLVAALIDRAMDGDVRVLLELLDRDIVATEKQGPLTDVARTVRIALQNNEGGNGLGAPKIPEETDDDPGDADENGER